MKYIKRFENLEEPEIGDYVLLQVNRNFSNDYKNFINNNIGEIVSIDKNTYTKARHFEIRYYIDTFEEFSKMKDSFRYISFDVENEEYYFSNLFNPDYVVEFGKTKEEVELKIATKKYNL